jgi:DNA-binding response OmpR family regulator
MSCHRVLLVDDDPLNQYLICESLRQLDLECNCADSAERAWDLLQDSALCYDAVVLDRMLPGMSGIELLQRIKAQPHLAQLPVIMQTGAASPEQVREGLAAGAYYYLTKPFEPEQLVAILRAALSDALERGSLERHRRAQAATLRLLDQARFFFRTVAEAQQLATFLSSIFPNSEAVALGLAELLINAVEHGNLGISYAEKSRLRFEDRWDSEVLRRQALPEHRYKRASIVISMRADDVVFTITDEGPGFDWRRYLEFDPDRAYDPNGRGIALARQLSFSRLEYRDPGNVAEAVVGLEVDAFRAAEPRMHARTEALACRVEP